VTQEEERELRRLASEIIAAFAARGLRLAVAESTTGGLIGHMLTEVPGSSAAFAGGVIAYDNRLKERLGVPRDVLATAGSVSADAAEAMAMAVRAWAGVDLSVAETGIAGPGGGSHERPVGLFFIAAADETGVVSERVVFEGDRSANKLACARAVLELVRSRMEYKV
jgi:PncC family amidohydrolase